MTWCIDTGEFAKRWNDDVIFQRRTWAETTVDAAHGEIRQVHFHLFGRTVRIKHSLLFRQWLRETEMRAGLVVWRHGGEGG